MTTENDPSRLECIVLFPLLSSEPGNTAWIIAGRERKPQDPRVVRPMAQLVRELVGVQRSCDMPKGTSDEWYKAIYALVNNGYLKMEHGTHVSRVKVAIVDPPTALVQVTESRPVHLGLFDL